MNDDLFGPGLLCGIVFTMLVAWLIPNPVHRSTIVVATKLCEEHDGIVTVEAMWSETVKAECMDGTKVKTRWAENVLKAPGNYRLEFSALPKPAEEPVP